MENLQYDTIKTEPTGQKLYFCRKCLYEGVAETRQCPQCRKTMQTQQQIKVLGQLLKVTGFFLTIASGLLFLILLPIILLSPDSEKKAVTTLMTTFIFGLLMVFGITCILGGSFQEKHGKPNRLIKWVVLSLSVLVFIAARAFSSILG